MNQLVYICSIIEAGLMFKLFYESKMDYCHEKRMGKSYENLQKIIKEDEETMKKFPEPIRNIKPDYDPENIGIPYEPSFKKSLKKTLFEKISLK